MGFFSLETPMKFRNLLAVFLCASLMLLPALAQSPTRRAPVQQREEKKDDPELQQKVLAILDELIADAPSFKLPENRIRIMSVAADMLWQQDEKRARALFLEAANLLSQLIHQSEDAPDAIPENFRWGFFQQRQEIVQMIAAHDAQLASDFLAATRPPADGKNNLYNPENEAQLELTLAQQIARQDPKKALQIAKEKLATAKSPSVVSSILYSLREKDPAAAQELADAIVAKMKSETQLSQESASFAINLLSLAPPPSPPDGNGIRPSGSQTPLITPAAARELIEKVLAAIQAQLAAARRQNDRNQGYQVVNLMNQLKSMMPYVELYAPASVAAIKRSAPEIDRLKDVNQRRWDDLNAVAEKGSPDALLEAASKVAPEMRYGYYERAAQIAKDKGDIERARQILNDNLTDPNQRRQALSNINQQRMSQSISEGRFDEARGLLALLRNAQERVNALMQMASAALNAGKKEVAAQFLNEAWALVDGAAESNQQFNAQLQIAVAYLKLNPARSFEIIGATVDQFNELFAASAMLENFDQNGTFREKEMILRNGGRSSQYFYQYGQALGELAQKDMPHVQAVIAQFARAEVRASIRILVLQQILRAGQQNYPSEGFGRRHLGVIESLN
jgi:hypothetical protein